MVLSLEVTIHDSRMKENIISMGNEADGRHARSKRTRAAVASAMLDCLADGMLRPSAKDIAARAGVSTRAVFRHFDNMDALLEEVAQLQISQVSAQLPPLLEEGTLDQRVGALVLHSARRNEIIAPVRRAALLSEPFSKLIHKRHAWLRSTVRRQVVRVFAEELNLLPESGQRDLIAALRALLSFSYWEALRRHEGLSNDAAIRVLGEAVGALLRPANIATRA